MAAAKPELLVVEDELELRALLSRCLRANGYVVKSSGNGAEALAELARTDSVRLIVLDLNMPDIGGVEVLEFVRGQDKLRMLPIIIVTMRGDDSSRTQALAAGATRYLTKPFAPEVILGEVNALIPNALQASG